MDLFMKFLEFIDFTFIGVTTFSVQLFITVFLTELAGVEYYVAYAVALAIAWSLNFMLNASLTFSVKDSLRSRLRRFGTLFVINIMLNWIFVVVAVEKAGLHYLPAIIISTIVLAALNFLVEEFWVFRKRR
jgi:putative flippase GtrA